MEIWDAYDENYNIIEGMTLVRGDEAFIPEGVYHLVCDIIVKHIDGTYLLMQRDPRKHYPLMWEASAGGSALKGESPLDAATRELFEETGIKSSTLKEIGRKISPKNRTAYADFYCETDCDKESIVLQEGETVAYRWVTRDELLNLKDDEIVTKRVIQFLE